MNILDALIDSLTGKDLPVKKVCCGAFWTMVTTGNSGLASTYREQDLKGSDDHCMVPDSGRLTEKSAGDLVKYARSNDTVSASIGMATINSLIEVDQNRCRDAGAYEVLAEKGRGLDVAVVGHFPFIPKLRDIARNVWVIEKQARSGDFDESEAKNILPKADVVSLTGTAFINHTIEDLLGLCKDSYVVLTGPTSPLSPVLFDFGIHAICGTKVVNVENVERFVMQAAIFKQIKGNGVRLLTMTADT
ncbi:MAG: Rossmann-like domain-containing protein [Desulfomonilaceae bacterium]